MQLFERLCNMIIRPERHLYRMSELGPREYNMRNCRIKRVDFEVAVDGSSLQASLYRPSIGELPACAIYLHSNSGSRVEGGAVKDLLLQHGLPVCLFDFRGSGLSPGQYVSYGHSESRDLAAVADHLSRSYGFDAFLLWGRSMGAATALMFAADPGHHRILATIADSSYYDLNSLLEHIGAEQIGIPQFLLRPLLYAFESSISKRAGFNLSDIHMGSYVSACTSPVVFVASKSDSVVPVAHSERLYKEYKGRLKELFYIEEDHQLERTPSDMAYLARVLLRAVAKTRCDSNLKLSMLYASEPTSQLEAPPIRSSRRCKLSMVSNRKLSLR